MQKTVAIIGAGIVGVATAIWMQRDGWHVILIDKKGPSAGASFGNGGVLAACACIPVTGPGLLRKVPKMLLDPNLPLFLRWSYLPKLLPWVARYLSHANADDTKRIAAAVAGVVGDTVAEHEALAAGTGAEGFIRPSDYLYVYSDRAAFEAEAFSWGLRSENGITWRELDAPALHAQEPALSEHYGFGVMMGNHGRIADPGAYIKMLAAHLEASGGQVVTAQAEDIVLKNGTVRAVVADGEEIACDACVLAAGVWSGPLAEKLGVSVPLEAERGYHLEFWGASKMPKTPLMLAEGKFVATPMEGRLRCAGVVEFAGVDAPPSRAPFAFLKKSALAAFPDLTWDRIEEWVGPRPATTDSIPVIGPVPKAKGVFMGFGHQHIGLTAGPKTGRLLSQMINGRTPNLDVWAYSPARFTKSL